MSKPQNPREQAEAALRQAHRATKQGDLKEAERWSKVAERLADSADKLARLPQPDGEDAEAIRTEIRRRIQRLVSMDQDNQLWDEQVRLHEIETAHCLGEGREPPPPLPPMPWSEKAFEHAVLGKEVKPPPAP